MMDGGPGILAAAVFLAGAYHDGDTFTAQVPVWPSMTVETAVRVEGVDTPELNGKCPAEIAGAEAAKARLAGLLSGAARIELRDVRADKFGGRVAARVIAVAPDGTARDVAEVLVAEGLGRAYDGGKRAGWC